MAANVKNLWVSYKSAVMASGVPEKNAEWFVRWALKFSGSITVKSLEKRKRSVINIRQFLMEFSVACTKKQILCQLMAENDDSWFQKDKS